jgi:hypothetical protein
MTLVVLAVLILVGGYFASGALIGASAADNASRSYVLVTTRIVTVGRQRIVTVRRQSATEKKREPVVVRREIRPTTAFETRFVTVPAHIQRVVRYVTVAGEPAVPREETVVETRLVPTVRTQTVTDAQTVTTENTVLVTTTVDKKAPKPPPPVTVTVTVTTVVTTTAPPPPPPKH